MKEINGPSVFSMSPAKGEIYRIKFKSQTTSIDVMNNTWGELQVSTSENFSEDLEEDGVICRCITLPPWCCCIGFEMPFSEVYIKALTYADGTISIVRRE